MGFFIVKILKLYYNNVIEIQLKEIEMIYFRKAGKKITGSNETVFFTSESRIRSLNETIFIEMILIASGVFQMNSLKSILNMNTVVKFIVQY